MNSVTMVRKSRTSRLPTENRPQKRPKRSFMSRAWPTPVTAPSRTTISWLTMRTGISKGRTHKQAGAVVLARLRVRRHPAGVVVAHHDDDARADDGGQGQQAGAPTPPGPGVLQADRAQSAANVTDVLLVEDGRGGCPDVRGAVQRVVGHGRWTSGLVGLTRCLRWRHASARGPPRRPCPVPTRAPEVGEATLCRRSVLLLFLACSQSHPANDTSGASPTGRSTIGVRLPDP